MDIVHHDRKKPPTRSLITVLLAWIFIGGQALLSAGTAYNYKCADTHAESISASWQMIGYGADRIRSLATPDESDTAEGIAFFLVVGNALGLVGLLLGLLSLSRSRHASGRLTIAAAVIVVWVNVLLNLPLMYTGLLSQG
jgi:hypothetical protein